MRVPVAIFDDLSGKTLTMVDMNVEELHDMANHTRATRKEDLPLFIAGKFGTLRTAKGSLRSDDNLIVRTGWAVDYDGEVMSLDDAKARCNATGVACFGYASPSHRTNAPRWRIAGPLSREITAAEYPRMIARINGVLGGVLAAESFKITQAMFIGRIDGVDFDSFVLDHEEGLDEVEELDRRAIPLPGQTRRGKPKGGKPDLKDLDEDELEEEIKSSRSPFHASGRLLFMWALQGIPKDDAQADLEAIFDAIKPGDRGPKWKAHRAAIPQWVDRIYARAAKHLGTYLARLVSYLEEDTLWRGALRLNQFTQTIEAGIPFPPQQGQPPIAYRALREVDTLEALLVVQAKGFPKATITDVWRAIILAAEHQGYHPVREYLDGLVWDEVPRIHRLFFDYFPGELPPEETLNLAPGKNELSWRDKWAWYYEKTAECFMIGAVARVMSPGCKCDSLPIFVSEQRYNKGLGLQALVGNPAWYSDDIPVEVVDRDAKDALVGKWVVELAEMPHLRRDVERFKAFVSRQADRFRRAYERLPQDWPRQTALTGTSNDLTYLDVTGNRRFWAIPLDKPVDVTLIKQDRDQLWAEAVQLYKNKVSWWLSDEMEDIAAEIQAGYVEEDILEHPIADWIEKRRDKTTKHVAPFEMTALYPAIGSALGLGSSLGLNAGPTTPSKADQGRVASCLKRLGFRRTRQRITGVIRRVWIERKP
jgi:hypothetical protein